MSAKNGFLCDAWVADFDPAFAPTFAKPVQVAFHGAFAHCA
jgi:hypothetical protein